MEIVDHIIQTRGLSKTYGNVQALRSLDLSVPRHSIFGFLGPNGAGKTTAMKILLGLTLASAGSATIFGLDIAREGVEIREKIGYLPQQPQFIDYMTARETLRFAVRFFFKGPDNRLTDRVDEMLELVGLETKANRVVRGFSGGERQRLGIAQAQINYPDLLILDEPAAALDPIGRRDVLAVMERLRKHTTILYSTHILDDVQQVGDTVAILNRGELVAQGPIDQWLAGSDAPVYSIAMKGQTDGAYTRLKTQPWVSQIEITHHNGIVNWQVGVSDVAAAEEQLLRLVLQEPELAVIGFQRKQFELEDVFMKIVEGA